MTARALWAVAGAGIAALAAMAIVATRGVLADARLPLWDMAAHGLAGIRLAEACASFRPWRVAAEIYSMAGWPPGLPLLECPVFLVGGIDYSIATGLLNVLFGVAIVAAFAAGAAIGGSRGLLVGAVTAALLAASPIAQQYGTLVMMEIPGVLLALLAFAAYAHWARRPTARGWLLVCLATVALFFVKYNYGLLWMVALGVAWGQEFGRDTVRAAWSALGRRARARRPFDVFVVVYCALLAAIVLTGGVATSIAGMRISIRTIGNPAFFLAVVILLRAARHPRANIRQVRSGLSRLPIEPRIFAYAVAFPILVWLAPPFHLREFFIFIGNRSSGPSPWTIAGVAYYPRAFAGEYSPFEALGWCVLAAAAVALALTRRLGPGERVAPFAFWIGIAASTFHHYKDPRFIFTVAPFAWVSCGLVLAAAIARWGRFAAAGRAVVALGAIGLALGFAFDRDAIRRRHVALTAPAGYRGALDRIAGECATSRGTALFGTCNALSPGLVEWHLRLRGGSLPDARRPRGANRYSKDRIPAELLNAVAADLQVETLLIVAPSHPESLAAFTVENPWVAPLRIAVRTDPRFVPRSAVDAGSGLRVESYAVRH